MPSFPRRTLLSHLMIVLASLFCGFGMWLVVQLNERGEITLEIEAIPAPTIDPQIDISFARSKVPVRFSFPATELNKMNSENFTLTVDVPDLLDTFQDRLEDNGNVLLSKEMVTSDLDMERLNIAVTEILRPQLRWEGKLRNMPAFITPQIVGDPADGYELGDVKIEDSPEPTAILTLAAERRYTEEGVDRIQLPTEPLDISGRSAPALEQVNVILPDGVTLWQESSTPRRNIALEINEKKITRTIPGVPLAYQFVMTRNNLKAVVTPATVEVSLTGPQSAVNAVTLDMISFRLYGVSETPGETRNVAVDARIEDTELRSKITIAVNPQDVNVSIVDENPTTPTPSPTPAPTFTPFPSPSPSPSPSPTPVPTRIAPTPETQADDRPTT